MFRGGVCYAILITFVYDADEGDRSAAARAPDFIRVSTLFHSISFAIKHATTATQEQRASAETAAVGIDSYFGALLHS